MKHITVHNLIKEDHKYIKSIMNNYNDKLCAEIVPFKK